MIFSSMKQINLFEYLYENPWAKRLMGFDNFSKRRTIEQVENEYNQDKYKKLLGINSLDDVIHTEIGEPKKETTISYRDRLYKTTMEVSTHKKNVLIDRIIRQYSSKNICELGCGYGRNFSTLSKYGDVYGGEYSSNAVHIAQKFGNDVLQFNYYNSEDYTFIKPESTIVTIHSIEQIPDASCIIDSLENNKENINYVVHFEPLYLPRRDTFFGELRNKYTEINDYNRNLLQTLESRDCIKILYKDICVFGENPLNPTSVIVWRFSS